MSDPKELTTGQREGVAPPTLEECIEAQERFLRYLDEKQTPHESLTYAINAAILAHLRAPRPAALTEREAEALEAAIDSLDAEASDYTETLRALAARLGKGEA